MKKISSINYKNVLTSLLIFITFVIFNNLDKNCSIFSLGVYIAIMFFTNSIFITPFLYVLSYIVFLDISMLLSACSGMAIIFIFAIIYYYKKIRPKYEIILFSILSLVVFACVGNTSIKIDLVNRIYISLITIAISLISSITVNAIYKKGIKSKFTDIETIAFYFFTILFGVGVCNLISPLLWQAISILTILIVAFIYRQSFAFSFGVTLACPISIFYSDIIYLSIFLVYALICTLSNKISRYIAPPLIPVFDYILYAIFNVYGSYSIFNFIYILSSIIIFMLIPTKLLTNIKDKLYNFRDKQLVRETINRDRTMMSNKLYDLSGVFLEMSKAMSDFKTNTLTEDKVKIKIKNEIINNVCKDCSAFYRCREEKSILLPDLYKLIDIGIVKNKISLIDFPSSLSERCIHPNNILYAINKLIIDYKNNLFSKHNLDEARLLIAEQSEGVSQILAELALSEGQTLKYQTKLERKINRELIRNGFYVSEILCYGQDIFYAVSIILTSEKYDINRIENIISTILGQKMELREQLKISENKNYLSFNKSVNYDCIYGITKAKKDGSNISGDTHTVTRINNDKFMIALSDGMGSGEKAENVSDISLTLIETFFKAGLNSNLVLNTVNKLLSINSDDTFTALDICILDLNTLQSNFIKYGSPYGFIISKDGIKIIEGNTLPLGILTEITPSICNTKLNENDIVLLLTDGVSDAFKSSNDLIDFLRSQPALNPQTLTDNIIKKSIELSNGKKLDDMTALSIRICKK